MKKMFKTKELDKLKAPKLILEEIGKNNKINLELQMLLTSPIIKNWLILTHQM